MSRRKGKDALDHVLKSLGFNFTTTQLKGPMSFMYNKSLDENTLILVQAVTLVLVLLLVYMLDKSGAFAHIKSRRGVVRPLIVAVCQPKDVTQMQHMAVRRGVVDDALTANEEIEAEENDSEFLPRRGDRVELMIEEHKLAGIVLEAGLPRATLRGRHEWASRWGDLPCAVALLPGGDAVITTLREYDNINGRLLRWRFPRFLRKAFRRRTSRTTPVSMTATFFSSARNLVLGVAPVGLTYGKDLLNVLPELESDKSK